MRCSVLDLERMRKQKKLLKITSAELAVRADVPVSTVNKILSGATKSPQYQTVKRMEQVLGIGQDTDDHNLLREANPYQVSSAGYTAEDYFSLPKNTRAELIDGTFYYLAAPTILHQRLVGEAYFKIRSYIEQNHGQCEVMLSPIAVQLSEDVHTILEPDLLVVCDQEKLKDEKCVHGAPDFVMEVVSESSKAKDYMIKLNQYWSSGVKEYWIVDPMKQKVTTYLFSDQDMDLSTYSFEEKIPVRIYDQLLLDFSAVL